MIKKLEWDSEFFSLNVGKLDDANFSDALNFADFDLLYLNSKEDFDLEIDGFTKSFSEEKVVFIKSLSSVECDSQNIYSLKETDYNINVIYELAFESGKNSRFLLDSKFGIEKFKDLYKRWIDNSISGGFADDVLVCKIENDIVGLLTYKTSGNTATVGLIAISSSQQGKGIGRKILNYLESLLFENRIKKLLIPTQSGNLQACKFYTKSGYSISEGIFIKHYWKIT